MKLNYCNQCQVCDRIINCRFLFLYVLIFLLFIGLIARIVYLQLINYNTLLHEGDMRSLRMRRLDTYRGMIRDRVGRLLAISVPGYAVCVNPKEICKSESVNFFTDQRWKVLSEILSIPLTQIASCIYFKSDDSFLYLARQISKSVADYVIDLKLPGVYLRSESRRYYPCAKIMAHVVGVTDIDGNGIEGVEKTFDSLLTGRPGQRIVRQDRFGRVIENISSVEGQVANNIFLSIDERLQTVIYHELDHAVIVNKAESGSAVLIDVDTGEILAMVNSPSYNPNNLSIASKRSIRNRAISDLFEPGSTVKPIVIMAALRHGIIHEDSVINTSPYFVNGFQIKDVVHHDRLSVKDILQKSSNVGVSKLALKMPYSILVDTYSKFGIGRKTNLGLVGESYHLSFCKHYCSDIERAALSYGYGVMVTPLQLAKVYATIGSMGVARPLSIIRKDSKVFGEQVFPESLVRTVVRMMDDNSVISILNRDENKFDMRYRFAIKTGTAKKVGKNGKYVNNYIAYTVGVAPLSNPKFALVVIINDPRSGQYYGGSVSAPVFRTIMRSVIRITDIYSDKTAAVSLINDDINSQVYQSP